MSMWDTGMNASHDETAEDDEKVEIRKQRLDDERMRKTLKEGETSIKEITVRKQGCHTHLSKNDWCRENTKVKHWYWYQMITTIKIMHSYTYNYMHIYIAPRVHR